MSDMTTWLIGVLLMIIGVAIELLCLFFGLYLHADVMQAFAVGVIIMFIGLAIVGWVILR